MGRIVIVDDEKIFADILAWILRKAGHEVFTATTPMEGIEQGILHQPDIIIADWILKNHIHGGEVARHIHAAWPHARTIIITGHIEMVSQARSWCDCIDEVIEKPFHRERILAAVNQLLSERELVPADAC